MEDCNRTTIDENFLSSKRVTSVESIRPSSACRAMILIEQSHNSRKAVLKCLTVTGVECPIHLNKGSELTLQVESDVVSESLEVKNLK